MNNPEILLKIAANSAIPVLLQGESGVGKEVAARKLHRESPRRRKPFVALNCGAIPKNLVESTFEGSLKGAFTGASTEQTGVVRAAEGGTLFLDEIGELPLESQCRLLRILQEKAVMPIGATEAVKVNFRLVCATNRDLREEVAAGRFREDLYFRINAFPIVLPPLRQRKDFRSVCQELWKEILEGDLKEDLEKDLKTDMDGCRDKDGKWVEGNSDEGASSGSRGQEGYESRGSRAALAEGELLTLEQFKWPGNIRQLKNVLQRYSLLRMHRVTLEEILADEFQNEPNFGRMPTPDAEEILRTLRLSGGNKSLAARELGISRGSLCYQIKKLEEREFSMLA